MAEAVDDPRFDKLLASRGLFDRFAAAYELAGPPSVYVRCGNALINRSVIDETPDFASRAVEIHGALIDVALPFSADEVLVGRNNTRIFGFQRAPDHSAKITSAHAGARILTIEARARRTMEPLLAQAEHVTLPALVAYDRRRGEWLVEEFVEGLSAGHGGLMPFVAAGAAREFYQATARLRPISRNARTATLAAELARLDPSFPPIADDALWPVAMLHGDLDPGNLLMTADGRICVVDLEMAEVGPVAADLATLYRLQRTLKHQIFGLLERLDPTGAALPPRLQLALGIVLASRGHRRVNPQTSTRGAQEMLATLRQ